MSEKEIIVELREMNQMDISCPDCTTRSLFDVASGARVPERCSSCGRDFSDAMKKVIREYQNFFNHAGDQPVGIKFHIKER